MAHFSAAGRRKWCEAHNGHCWMANSRPSSFVACGFRPCFFLTEISRFRSFFFAAAAAAASGLRVSTPNRKEGPWLIHLFGGLRYCASLCSEMTALHFTLLVCISWLAVAFAAEPTRRQTKLEDGERRQIFRDEVDHLKKAKRPAGSNQGYYQPQEDGHQPPYEDSYRPDTQDNYRPTYQDNYQPPNQDVDYPSNYGDKPVYQQDYKPSYEDEYKPTYHDEERPPYEDDYKPNYQDDHKPPYQDGYKPSYEDTPLYEDDYKPIEQDNYKPTFDDADIPFFKPIDFDINFYGAGNQKPDGYDGYDQHQEQKPYVPPPPQYDDYEPVKPVAPKPYKPAVPKPYKPRPTYPKEVVLLKPSLALKSNAYADKYTTPNYRPSHIPGTPGEDYPNYTAIPETSFDCLNFKNADFSYMFSDRDSGCQVFHTCHDDGRQDSFLCPLGTIFDVESQTCDWWFNVRCI